MKDEHPKDSGNCAEQAVFLVETSFCTELRAGGDRSGLCRAEFCGSNSLGSRRAGGGYPPGSAPLDGRS